LGKFTFNHLSGTGLPRVHLFPKDVAQVTNEAAYRILGYAGQKRVLGVLIMDYPGENLIARIVRSNFGVAATEPLRISSLFSLYEDKDCTGKFAGSLVYPGPGASIVWDASTDEQVTDNAVRSIRVAGSIRAGTRISVGGSAQASGSRDNTVITFLASLGNTDTICLRNLKETLITDSYVQYYQPYNVLVPNAPTRFVVEQPTDSTAAFAVNITAHLQWTRRHVLQGPSQTPNLSGGPMVGMYRPKTKIGGLSFLQASPSPCSSGTGANYWTKPFTSLQRKATQCQPNYMVGQVVCLGLGCSLVSLRCYEMSVPCQLDPAGASSVRELKCGEEDQCPFGSIVTGMRCRGLFCRSLEMYCTKITI